MSFLRKIAAVLLFAIALGHADDFMGLPIEDAVSKDVRALPTWIVGGGASLAYYLTGIDGTVDLDAEYRVHRLHSIGIHGGFFFAGEFFDTGLDWRWYFKGALMQTGHDDFLHFTVSAFCLEHLDEWFFSPAIGFGYGRDILFFKKSDMLGRIEILANYLLGEPIYKFDERRHMEVFGRFVVNIRFSLLIF